MLLDHTGRPLMSDERQQKMAAANHEVFQLRRQITREVKARYDAAQTTDGNERHWANADYMNPHQSSSLSVRRKLRSRSRYEVLENNPYLKGTLLTVANDFVGSGPKLQILDKKRFSKEKRTEIETKFWKWFSACKIREKLWRMRLGKSVDGESFLVAFTNNRRRFLHRDLPVTLDFQLVETDRICGPNTIPTTAKGISDQAKNELDGVQFDEHENPLKYHILNNYPGMGLFADGTYGTDGSDGKWVNSDYVIHWFRKDRSWLRGIPETAPSLPLCALLRRYTLATVRAAEIAAMFSAILETDGPASATSYQTGDDDPFDTFPIEHGMFTTMPWGYKMSQLKAEHPVTMYDAFVDALLREIVRPLLVPFNISAGSSADANMSSAVLDAHIYKTGQNQERLHCEEMVLEELFAHWWLEASRINNGGYLKIDRRQRDFYIPEHSWRWDRIGLDHTDPSKVQQALKIAHDKGFLTDRDIQESYYNRDVDTWRDDLKEDAQFREELEYIGMADSYPKSPPGMPPVPVGGQPADAPPKKAPKAKTKKN